MAIKRKGFRLKETLNYLLNIEYKNILKSLFKINTYFKYKNKNVYEIF